MHSWMLHDALILDKCHPKKDKNTFAVVIRYTIDRKSWYNFVAGEFTKEDFAKVCNLSVKAVVEKLVETSVENALDKKAEWATQAKDNEDVELKQVIKTTLASTKGKHGRRTVLQEELSLDDMLIADNKQTLKEAIRTALNDMEHEYETVYIKAALIRSHHLAPHISFSVFLRAICVFSGREYKYDPAPRADTFIYFVRKRSS